MPSNTNNSHKTNANLLSEQVKEILNDKGLSKVFNYQDYASFKNQVKDAYNKAQAIAEKFIYWNSDVKSDFSEYVF
jgi:hypothetical protein